MSVVTVDFSAERRSPGLHRPPTKVAFTLNLHDVITGKELDIYAPLAIDRRRATIRDVIEHLRDVLPDALQQAASMLFDSGYAGTRSLEEVSAQLIVQDVYVGLSQPFQDLQEYLVADLTVFGKPASTASRVIYATDSLDAELHARLEEAETWGYFLDRDAEETCNIMLLMESREVRPLPTRMHG